MAAEPRSVHARWDGGMRAVVQAGDFQIVVDQLIPHAERVCYVTNTLRRGPQVQIRSQAAALSA